MIRSTFALPVLIGVLLFAGLLFALTGGGARDGVAALALSLPIIATLWAVRFRRS